jgi:hypothetical protein
MSKKYIKFRQYCPTLQRYFTPQWISGSGLQILNLHTNNKIHIQNNPENLEVCIAEKGGKENWIKLSQY